MSPFVRPWLPLLFALSCISASWADATLFVQEPYGLFGAINPTGHASVYLSRVCADSPVVLRRCDRGELGIVISRYRKVSGYDWIAIPLAPYLYAVEDFARVPEEANLETVVALREEYRRRHLRNIVPDGPDGRTPAGSWVELVGAAYNRKIYGFQIQTTEAQDDHLISVLNSHTITPVGIHSHRPRIIAPRARLLPRIHKRSHADRSPEPTLPPANHPRRSLAPVSVPRAVRGPQAGSPLGVVDATGSWVRSRPDCSIFNGPD